MSTQAPLCRGTEPPRRRGERARVSSSGAALSSAEIAYVAAALATLLAACAPTPTSQAHWTTRAAASSAFSATLYEDTYNDGDSTLYSVRFEKREGRFGGGWFVKKSLDGDQPHPKRPTVSWTTPKDVKVIVYTDHIEGRIVQTFTNPSGTDGTLTLEYEPAP